MAFVGFEMFYRFMPNNYTLKHQELQKRYKTVEVLIFGNSHTFYGLNPKYFDRPTFNLGNLSQSLYFDQMLFEKHIDHLENLKFVILNVEHFNLSAVVNSSANNLKKHYYRSYMDLDVPIVSMWEPKAHLLFLNVNIQQNRGLLARYFREGTLLYSDSNGFGTNYPKAKALNIKKNVKESLRRLEDHLIDFSENTARLQSIIDRCKSKNIEVILVTMPYARLYREGVNQKKVDKAFLTCRTLDAKNDNVRYLNLYDDHRFQDPDFFDADHLHDIGAIKSSKIMNAVLNTYDLK